MPLGTPPARRTKSTSSPWRARAPRSPRGPRVRGARGMAAGRWRVETCTGGGWRPGETQPSCPLHPPVFDLGECLGLSGVDKGLRFNLALVQVSFRTHPDFVSLFRKNPPNNFWAVTTCARPHHNSTKFFESFEWRKSVNSESLAAHMLNTYLLYLDLGRIQCISLCLEQEPPPTTLLRRNETRGESTRQTRHKAQGSGCQCRENAIIRPVQCSSAPAFFEVSYMQRARTCSWLKLFPSEKSASSSEPSLSVSDSHRSTSGCQPASCIFSSS